LSALGVCDVPLSIGTAISSTVIPSCADGGGSVLSSSSTPFKVAVVDDVCVASGTPGSSDFTVGTALTGSVISSVLIGGTTGCSVAGPVVTESMSVLILELIVGSAGKTMPRGAGVSVAGAFAGASLVVAVAVAAAGAVVDVGPGAVVGEVIDATAGSSAWFVAAGKQICRGEAAALSDMASSGAQMSAAKSSEANASAAAARAAREFEDSLTAVSEKSSLGASAFGAGIAAAAARGLDAFE